MFVAFIVPSLALYFRDDVLNDESCIEGEEILFGYITTWYGLVSLAIGIYGYFNAVGLNNLTIFNPNLEVWQLYIEK